jgi:hypothetical protein
MLPHDARNPYRKPILIAVTLLAMLVGIGAPGQPIEIRLATPFMAIVAVVGGFLVGWLPLRFQVLLWCRVAPRALRGLCLCVFYFFLIGTLASLALYPIFADELRSEGFTLGTFALPLPAGVGAAAGAYRAYADIPSA